MQYENPVFISGFPHPDVVRSGEDFYMVTSSAEYVPSVPVYHSKNLLDWELINYVLPKIPFERFNGITRGDGAGAPALRCNDGIFYCLVSFPEEGIFVAETTDPYGKWSLLRPLLVGKGFKSPCPLWANGKCYVVFSFDKKLSGVNSRLAVFETDAGLKTQAGKYAYVFDGSDNCPQTDNPKFYVRDDMFYIFASAGGKSGWQVALRSEKIYGPYRSKVIMTRGDTEVNGPFGGVMVDLDGGGQAFLHAQNMGAYGSAIHLEPVEWKDGWPVCGKTSDGDLPAYPVRFAESPVRGAAGCTTGPDDDFDGDRLSLKWQTPANPQEGWYLFRRGLRLNCVNSGAGALGGAPQIISQKAPYLNFAVNCKCKLNLKNDGDEVGFTVFGEEYSYICVVRSEGRNYLEIRKGSAEGGDDETLCRSQPYDDGHVTFRISAKYEEPCRLAVKYTFGGSAFTRKFYASPCRGGGVRLGIYARSSAPSDGYATFGFFRVVCTDNRVGK